MNDLKNNVKAIAATYPATITATANGLTVDLLGYKWAMFAILIGAVSAADADNRFNFTIEESDATGSGWAAVASDRIIGTLPSIIATSQANSVAQVGVTTLRKRYLRLVYTETGTCSALFGAAALAGGPHHAPVS